jgi:hypothetical protein
MYGPCNMCGKKRNALKILIGRLKEKDYSKELDLDGRSILK